MTSGPAPAPDYDLRVGELVLEGFEADPTAVASALRRELHRLLSDPSGAFAARPSASASRSLRQVELRGGDLAADASPREIARALGSAIVSQLSALAAAPGARR